MYVHLGRPSVPPEKLLRALLLQTLYTIRSERQLMEQLDYNLLFRWFVGLGLDDPVWSATSFTKNRDRLLDGDIAAAFFEAILILANRERSGSNEHFALDGMLPEAWASQKSFRPRVTRPPTRTGGNATVDFHGHQCRNATFVVEYQTNWSMKGHSLHPWSMGKYKPRRIGRASRVWITLA